MRTVDRIKGMEIVFLLAACRIHLGRPSDMLCSSSANGLPAMAEIGVFKLPCRGRSGNRGE